MSRRRSGKGRRKKERNKSDFLSEKEVDYFYIRRCTSLNFRKVCDDLYLDYGVVVDELLSNFILDVYRDKIKNLDNYE